MRVATAIVASVLLVACGNLNIKPGEKPHARRDIPPGKGVLTGSQGEFVIFRVEDAARDQNRETEQTDSKPTAK